MAGVMKTAQAVLSCASTAATTENLEINLEINLDNPRNFGYLVNMSFRFIHRLSAIVLAIVLLLCLPMAASPLHVGGGSSETISDIDVCDEDPTEILSAYLTVPEGFYFIVNLSTVCFIVCKTEVNAVIAAASRLEKPPAA
jgi:hypothetical protein